MEGAQQHESPNRAASQHCTQSEERMRLAEELAIRLRREANEASRAFHTRERSIERAHDERMEDEKTDCARVVEAAYSLMATRMAWLEASEKSEKWALREQRTALEDRARQAEAAVKRMKMGLDPNGDI